MNIPEEINIVKELVNNDGYIPEMVVDYLAEREIYHTVAAFIYSVVFDVDLDYSKARIYENEYFSEFKNEKNPFNEDFTNPK